MHHPDLETAANDAVDTSTAPDAPDAPRTLPQARRTNPGGSNNDPPGARVAGGLFDDQHQPARVQVLLRTGASLGHHNWEAAFAARHARTFGPTALITLRPGAAWIEFHGAASGLPNIPQAIRTRVDWAISWVSWFTRATVVVPIPEDQPGAYIDWKVPIQLLTTANSRDTVATYRRAKQIITTYQKHAIPPEGVNLVFVDSGSETARIAAIRINDTARKFMGCTLPMACTIERMPRVTPALMLHFTLEPGYGCDDILETLGSSQHPRTCGRLGTPPFS